MPSHETTLIVPDGCKIEIHCDCEACKKRLCAAATALLIKIGPNVPQYEPEFTNLRKVVAMCCHEPQPQPVSTLE